MPEQKMSKRTRLWLILAPMALFILGAWFVTLEPLWVFMTDGRRGALLLVFILSAAAAFSDKFEGGE